MNTAEKLKHRRMFYLGVAITIPLAVMEFGCLFNGAFHYKLFDWICKIGVDLYFVNAPLMVLLFNSQLRKDIPHAICCKLAQQNIIQVAPTPGGSRLANLGSNQSHMEAKF